MDAVKLPKHFNTKDFAQKGQDIYERKYKRDLESRFKGKIVAVDIVHGKLERLSDRARRMLVEEPRVAVLEDTIDVDFPKNLFDKVISASVLNYLSRPLPVLERLYTTLKKGGKIAMALSNSWLTQHR